LEKLDYKRDILVDEHNNPKMKWAKKSEASFRKRKKAGDEELKKCEGAILKISSSSNQQMKILRIVVSFMKIWNKK